MLLIRNPIEMLLSGYLYHIQKNNKDCNECDCDKMREMTDVNGLEFEAECSMHEVELMVEVFKSAKAEPSMLVLRLEDFMDSPASFDSQVQHMYEHLTSGQVDSNEQRAEHFVTRASAFDLGRHARPPDMAYDTKMEHVATEDGKQRVQALYLKLQNLPIMNRLQHYALMLGYE